MVGKNLEIVVENSAIVVDRNLEIVVKVCWFRVIKLKIWFKILQIWTRSCDMR